MKLLITGSNGQLGWELLRQGEERGFSIVPLDLPEFDITDQIAVTNVVDRSDPDVVINAAAYTAVDKAESDHALTFAVNREGPFYLAIACAEKGIPLIHVSTDYVFDGLKNGPYLETDPVSPVGIYGKSKAEGEAEVRRNLKEHIIVRTAWLYGVHGNNFVKTMLKLGKEREEIKVVADQYGCPTFAADLAGAILDITSRIKEDSNIPWGTYHYCGGGSTTWFGFASRIFEIAKGYESFKLEKVTPIKTAEYPTPAKRPANSVLDCSLLAKEFNLYPPLWDKSLETMLGCLFR